MILIAANAVQIPLAPRSVQMVATSPPYWGLRDYGSPDQLGHEPLHDCLAWARREDPCGGCFVCSMRQVFTEVRRVLRDDGTVWLNLGDSYSSGGSGGASDKSTLTGGGGRYREGSKLLKQHNERFARKAVGLQSKNLIGIPWRVALALQSDGWYLRSDIIWSKPNPMPESVTDRPTKAHEYIFLLSKSPRYYYDADALKEKSQHTYKNGHITKNGYSVGSGRNDANPHRAGIGFGIAPTGRNRRTVWTIATQPYRGAHFATWPSKLVEPMIRAGSAKGDIVLDPFAGSGTTGLVARQLGRRFVGLDLSAKYLQLARKRLDLDALESWNSGKGKKVDEQIDFGLFASGAPPQ